MLAERCVSLLVTFSASLLDARRSFYQYSPLQRSKLWNEEKQMARLIPFNA